MAQEPTPESPPDGPPITVAQIQERIAAIEALQALDESAKTRALELYNEAIASLNRAEEHITRTQQFEQSIPRVPELVRQLREASNGVFYTVTADFDLQPEELAQDPPPITAPEVTATQFEQTLIQIEADLTSAKARLSELENEPARRAERRRQLPELTVAARTRLQELTTQLAAQPAAGEAPELTEARRVNLTARRYAAEKEVPALEREAASYDARGQLLQLRIDQAARRVNRLERTVQNWREATASRRTYEAQQAIAQARRELLSAEEIDPEVREIAEQLASENEALARRRTGPEGLLRRIENVQAQRDQHEDLLEDLTERYESIQRRVEAAGSSGTIGLLLRQQKAELPNARRLRRNIKAREDVSSTIQVELIELHEERRQLADLDREVADALETAAPHLDDSQRQQLETYLRDLLQSKRQNLDALINDYENYFAGLIDLDAAETSLANLSEEFTRYIDQRVLWIRSGGIFGPGVVHDGWEGLQWAVDPDGWAQVLTVLRLETLNNTLGMGLGIAVFLALVLLQPRLVRMIREAGARACKATCTDYTHTVIALLATIGASLPVAYGLWFLGMRLTTSVYADDFSRAVGGGLFPLAGVYFLFEFGRELMRSGGLLEAHFDWPKTALSTMRRHLIWFMPVFLGAFFVAYFFDAQGMEGWKESLGRSAFLLALAGTFVYLVRVFTPNGGAINAILAARRGEEYRTVRVTIETIAFAVVVGLFIAALSGYYYTSMRLSGRFFYTFALIVGVLVVDGMVLRWLLLARRRLARELARQRRATLKAQAEAEAAKSAGDEALPTESTAPPPEEAEIDLAKVDLQSQRLLRVLSSLALIVGAWFVWAAELPAFEILNRVEIGSTLREFSATRINATTGEEETYVEERMAPITLAHLVTVIIIGLLTIAAARNIPGVLEIGILQRTSLGAGERNAISTIVRYIIVGVGIVAAFNTIGIGWSRIQWLVAALGVGLGFGLQEIFANFISGLIILFERPIRIGDTVTVGEVSGTVTRIRIRATTIMDWDRKELIVPNKEFITGRLVNWTLSDETIRQTIPVGISYSADVELAQKLLREAAKQNEFVLEDPAPQVVFMSFGDNSLDFELRVFCPDLAHFLPIRHDLHVRIKKTFDEAGIEIAFPQRDLHIRSFEDVLPIRRDGGEIRGEDEGSLDASRAMPREFGSG